MIVASLIIILLVLLLYIINRNNRVYCFNISLSDILFDELKRILNTYKNDNEFHEDKNNYNYIKDKTCYLLNKNSYEKYLFSFKPLELKNWFTKEELEFMSFLKQYRNEMSNV